MSTVSKLEIHGIRSFGIHSGDEQRITFHSPLTLIVGQNGCGKTSIIECLKYGITGDLPPNSDQGKSFVHNTKMAGASEAIGKVKLQVKDVHGNKTTIDRSHKVTVKARGGKPSANTLNCTVTHETRDGKIATMTRRKDDATAEMCQAMGVSRAIINNVIFCHQEDNNWPLEADKKVKENFDDIFGTSDYNKVLEELNKKMKDRDVRKKVMQEELKLKQHVKSQADQMTEKLQRYEQAIAKNQTEIEAIEEKLKPVRERIIEISKRESQASEIYKQEIQLKEKIKANESSQKSYKGRIKKLFVGDIEVLQQEIRDFQTNVHKVKDENETVDTSILHLKQQNEHNEHKIRKCEGEKIQLQQQIQQEQEKVSERAKFLQEIGPKVGIAVSVQIENEPNNVVRKIIGDIQDKIKAKDETLMKLKESHEQMEKLLQEKVDRARDKKTQIDASIATKLGEIKNNESEVEETERKVNLIEASATKLKDVTEKIAKIDSDFNSFNSQTHFTEMETSINTYKARRDTIQQENDALEVKIEQLNAVSKTLNEISFKEKQVEGIELNFKRIKNKHTDNLTRIFPNKTVDHDFKREVQRRHDELGSAVKEITENLNKKQRLLLQAKAKHQHLRTSVGDKEEELKRGEEAIYTQCQSDEFEDVKARTKEKVEKFQMELGANRASETLFKKYITDLRDRSCCPLCHNDMAGHSKDDLIEELSGKIHTLPEKVRQQEQQLKREERKLHDLLELGPTIDRVKKLRDDIQTLKQEIRELDDTIRKTQSDVEDAEMCLASPEEEKTIANNMLSDMTSLDRFKTDRDTLQTEIQSLKNGLPASQANENLEELKTKKKALQDELRELNTKIEDTRKQMDEKQRKLQLIQENRNKLLDLKCKLQENAQTLPQLKQRLEQLKQNIESARQAHMKLQRELVIAKEELNRAEVEKQKEKVQNKRILDHAITEKQQVDQLFRDICRCNDEISQFEELNLSSKLNELRQNLTRQMEERSKTLRELKSLEDQSKTLKETITKQEILERDLLENRDLKRAERDGIELKTQLDSLQLNLGELDFGKLSREKDRLQKQEDEMVAKRSNIHGMLSKEKEEANECRTELNKPNFRDAYRKYIETYHELRLLELIIHDIKQYRSALDVALTKYHQEKMSQINQSIRGLWQEIYRGNDIDYIEIRTEVKEPNKSRRNIEYRVVQVKNNTELDMRGRCSAGQKVLASLIIRMALSETFSTNCAVMALDEPTTNLDHANIASLCEAIGRIIENQQDFGHFSWIIITHDETFLQTLAPYLEASYRVSRNFDGKSVISKID